MRILGNRTQFYRDRTAVRPLGETLVRRRHRRQVGEVTVVQAEPPGQFPDAFDRIELRTVGGKNATRKSGSWAARQGARKHAWWYVALSVRRRTWRSARRLAWRRRHRQAHVVWASKRAGSCCATSLPSRSRTAPK
jgi:hypothetical protein